MTAKELREAAEARLPVVVRDPYNGKLHFSRIGKIMFEFWENGNVYMRCELIEGKSRAVHNVPAEVVELDALPEMSGETFGTPSVSLSLDSSLSREPCRDGAGGGGTRKDG